MRHGGTLAGIVLGTACLAVPANGQVPTVTLDWIGIHEMFNCARPDDQQRHLRARAEAERRLDEFRNIWAGEGPLLFRTAAEVTGQAFRFNEAIAVLHVCEEQPPGVSYPLLINLKWYLDALDGQFREHGQWRAIFAEAVFHEVLHRYIRDALGPGLGEPFRSTELMRRYAYEPLMTRTHLHLFAIQRAVYERLGRGEVIALTRAYGRDWPAYVRAHQIVDELGVDSVLADFRSAAQERRHASAD